MEVVLSRDPNALAALAYDLQVIEVRKQVRVLRRLHELPKTIGMIEAPKKPRKPRRTDPNARFRRSKAKGKTGEREVVHFLRAVWPSAKRGLGQARSAGEVPDVDVPGWWVEVKRKHRTVPRSALAQAVAASGGSGRIPVAICRDDGDKLGWTVTLRIRDWLETVPPFGKVRLLPLEIVDDRTADQKVADGDAP